MAEAPLLRVEHLVAGFAIDGRFVPVVRDVSFTLARGETLGLVGESGSGKSLTALSIVRLLPHPGRIASGRIVFEGVDLAGLDERALQTVRGRRIGFVFQEPMTALNPVFTIGDQIIETLDVHGIAHGTAARDVALQLLRDVAIADPARRLEEYPHQLSGGLRQRAIIALALAAGPSLLIADEPTTALDATIQAQILELLRGLQRRYDLAVLLITHDFGIVAQNADRVAVMYAGQIVEASPVAALFSSPQHPYTRALLASMPGVGARGRRLPAIPGTVPLPQEFGTACAFAPRCPARFAPCDRDMPPLFGVGDEHAARCFLHAPAETAAPAATRAARDILDEASDTRR